MVVVLVLVVAILGHASLASAQSPASATDDRLVPLQGRVLAGDGSETPLPGARLTVISNSQDSTPVTSDREGRFALLVPERDSWSLRVTKAGFAPVELPAASIAGGAAIVRMPRGAVVAGRVVDLQGYPVPGVLVHIAAAACPDPCPPADPLSARGAGLAAAQAAGRGSLLAGAASGVIAETDDLGEYRAGSLSAGRYEVRLAQSELVRLRAAALAAREALLRMEIERRRLPGPSAAAAGQPEPDAIVQLRAGEETTVHLVHDSALDASSVRNYAAGFNAGAQAATASRSQNTVQRPTGAIRGRIVDASGRPMEAARVQLIPLDGVTLRVVTSDAQGRFEIAAVPAGTFRLGVTKTGFTPVQYGQQRALQQGTTIVLRDGEILDQMDVRLPPGGVITGRVVDAYGEPLEGISVTVLQSRFSGGRAVLAPASGVLTRRTDDRGHYRIYGLLPGTYYVVATEVATGPHDTISGGAPVVAMAASSPDLIMSADRVVMSPDRAVAFAGGSERAGAQLSPTIFHPGSPSVADAVSVRIEPGLDAYGIDVTFTPSPATRVHGIAIDSEGRLVRGTASLTVSHRSGAPAPPPQSVPVMADGTFEFSHVVPGDYVVHVTSRTTIFDSISDDLRVSSSGRILNAQVISMVTGMTAFGMQYVTVSGVDDVPVAIRTTFGSRITGRVTLDGDRSSVNPSTFQLEAVPADFDRTPATARVRSAVTRDWRFELTDLIGPQRLQLAQAPPGWYLKSAMVTGVDAAEYPVAFGTAELSRAEVEVVIARAGTLSGEVVDERREPALDYSVVVFSTDPTRWYDRSRHLKLARSSHDGGFSVTSLPPGEYWVVAIDGIQGDTGWGDWQNPDVLGSLVPGARRVQVGEGQRVVTELRLVRMPR